MTSPTSSRPGSRRWRVLLTISTGLGLLLGASSTTAGAASAFPVTVVGSVGNVRVTTRPDRIISLSPTATDMLYSIGAGSQVVAVDSDSTIPASAPRTSLSGLEPNVEAIAHYRPDLVVISYDPSGLASELGHLGIPVLEQDAARTLHGTYGEIAALGRATGHVANAEALIAKMRSKIASAVSSAPRFSPELTYYYELDQTYYSVTSNTFIGSLLSMFHLRDIANAASGASSGYPQLSAEFILKSDPRLILLADTVCCGQSAGTVAKRPGWSSIAAVKDHAVLGLNDSVASLWGPTVVQLADKVAAELRKLHAGTGG